MKRLLSAFLALILMAVSLPVQVLASEPEELTVLFTHDIHDYLYPTETVEDGEKQEHGGAARLATLLKENAGENTIYLDCGDFSMGTLMQAAYSTDAFELRNLGLLGCAVTTFGNHEFDYGADGVAEMLRAAVASGDPLPQIVQSNIDFSGNLTASQQNLMEALEEYGAKEYTILEAAGYRIGVFGLVGYDCIECIQTDLSYLDYIEAASSTVAELEAEGCDLIVALSHSGTSGDGINGEDFDLAAAVPGIDLIISGHSHSTYATPVQVGDTLVVSAGEYLKYLGSVTIAVENGKAVCRDYQLIPIDSSVEEDPETALLLSDWMTTIEQGYLADYGVSVDQVICRSNFDTISLGEMYSTHQEYNTGDLIADAYAYEAARNGITDVDVFVVGLGTIRGSVTSGDITVADAFEICSLGVGADGSAGHPLVCAYVTGKELKLLTELDASLGTMVSSIKMSYSGLSYTFNTSRIIMDRVTDVHLVRDDGNGGTYTEKIEDGKMYKVCANMYAVNMLGMLNGLTKGILSITPKDADGNPISDFYEYSLKDENGKEIKEWVALMHYLMSFEPDEEGIPVLPEVYSGTQGRKIKVSEGGWAVISHPGTATKIVPGIIGGVALFLLLVILLIVLLVHRRRKKKRLAEGLIPEYGEARPRKKKKKSGLYEEMK